MISILPAKLKAEKAHLRNLVIMAKADNYLDVKEIDCINKIGRNLGLTDRQIEESLHASKNEAYEPPVDKYDKFSQLYDLITVMLSDGVIKQKESDFCAEIAIQMGVRKPVSDLLITKILRCIEMRKDKEKTYIEVEPFMS